MTIICCICQTAFETVKDSYNHNTEVHPQVGRTGHYFITSCIICRFSHQNPAIVKVHTEVAHKTVRDQLFISHPRYVCVHEAIRERNTNRAFVHQIATTFSTFSKTQQTPHKHGHGY